MYANQAKPAILGTDPIFKDKIYIVRPLLPEYTDLENGTAQILASGMVTKGQNLQAFEQAVADHLKVKHAIAISSCTSGLMLTYKGLNLSGEVIVPSFTFMATVSALIWAGLKPVFVDIDPDTTNIDPKTIEAAITPKTSAVVAIHNFGNPAEIAALQAITTKHNLKLIFDAAHGFGARYQGEPVGSQGDAQIYSLSPTKLLIAGEGGIIATNDDHLAEKVRIGREYGNDGNYDSLFAGINARMPEFNALLGLKSLNLLEQSAQTRNQIASLYHEELGRIPGIGFQKVAPGDRNSYKDFSITINTDEFGLTRDELAAALAAENIDTRKYYDPPVHQHLAYKSYTTQHTALPNTEWLSTHSLSLPIWSNMNDDVAVNISRAIQQIYHHNQAVRKNLSAK